MLTLHFVAPNVDFLLRAYNKAVQSFHFILKKTYLIMTSELISGNFPEALEHSIGQGFISALAVLIFSFL